MSYRRTLKRGVGCTGIGLHTGRAVRLYMVPGMIECNGGPGTDTFDMLGVMRRWVERGEAPREVIASRVEHGKVVRTRPLCPYPQVATYKGKGSTDEPRASSASNYLPPVFAIGCRPLSSTTSVLAPWSRR